MMDLPVMKFLAESVRNTAEVLLKTMQDGKSFVCDECFGNNFVPCEEGNINAIQMMAGGNTSWWHCGYCSLKYKNEGLKNAIINTTKILQSIVERHTNGTIRGTMTDMMRLMEQDVNAIQQAIELLEFHNGD